MARGRPTDAVLDKLAGAQITLYDQYGFRRDPHENLVSEDRQRLSSSDLSESLPEEGKLRLTVKLDQLRRHCRAWDAFIKRVPKRKVRISELQDATALIRKGIPEAHRAYIWQELAHDWLQVNPIL